MRRFVRDNGLSLALLALFLLTAVGTGAAGLAKYNDDRRAWAKPPLTFGQYLSSAHFWEAMAENWESEFLQMGAYVLLTIGLYQRGAAESKDPDAPSAVDRAGDPGCCAPDAPWPVRRGGVLLILYENSLSLALFALFALSITIHAVAGAAKRNEVEAVRGKPAVSPLEYLWTDDFWFESLQNWQSEFLSIGLLVLLTIWLRQRGSTQSKPVDFPHHRTGTPG